MKPANISESVAAPVNPVDWPTGRKFLIFGILAFGQFMALLDIQIVAASLNEVQAGLSAGPDEVSWVQTAYLMAELVMIPFSAFLAQAMSTRWLFATSAGLFTLSSIACGLAWDIGSMSAFRAIQGFVGGAMVPSVFAVGFMLFQGKQRALIPAILGMVSVLAPTLGPTVGGIITDAMNWRWIFFVNVPPGIIVTVLTIAFVKIDSADPGMFARIDWSHLLAMAVALGGLEYVLEEGPRNDWFGDPVILMSAWFSLVAFVFFVERSLFSKNPIVRVSPFRNPTFAFACLFNIVIGFGIYASTYLLPVYLGRIRDFDSLQIGTTVFVVGVGQLFSTVVSARLSQIVDPRYLITVGLTGFASSMWMTSYLGSDWGFGELLVPQLVRGLFVMLCIVPSVTMALSGFQGPELRSASGLFNLMRNLGGAIGIATVNTWLQDNTRIQALRFGEALSHSGRPARDVMAALARQLHAMTPDPDRALLMAQGLIGHIVARESLTIAFNEVFRLMSWMFFFALVMVPFCRPAKGPPPSPADSH
ncbi:DHA2 family efflux MFS transporter permease subunit [Bradyrhizobium sp. dw_411]|uniref:DHA2 family efflux MFS transporter permease subunit n=1 Tax=Bradyrhizobium sp. dw_411 TaxID=2720082 RepID=UPI001BD174F6